MNASIVTQSIVEYNTGPADYLRAMADEDASIDWALFDTLCQTEYEWQQAKAVDAAQYTPRQYELP